MSLAKIGRICKQYRKKVLKCTQRDVSRELGFTQSNVSSFENGRNDSYIILLWYMEHGLTLDQLVGGEPIE